MNANAANALLKNLEEPPARTLFVLIAHSPGGLLPTIRSRCQLIKLKPLAKPELLRVLEALGTPLPDEEAGREALAVRAGGSVRDALLLTQYGGLDIAEAIAGVVRARAFPINEAWRIAEAVGGRDNAVQFAIFNQTALDMVAGWAREAAIAGDLEAASRHSRLWQEAERLIGEAETYNLDKKQHALMMIDRLNAAIRM